MDRRERIGNLSESLLAAFLGWQTRLWTALPAEVKSFNPSEMTITAQPVVLGRIRSPDGSWQDVRLPLLLDVPVVFPSAGGFSLTFPVQPGDEALIVFSARDMSAWWYLSGVQPAPEVRMHDLSDGFALIGPRSRPRAVSGWSTTTTQLRSDDGSTVVEVADGQINLTATTVNINGDAVITGEATIGGIAFSTHVHGGVDTGPGTTQGPQ